MIMKLMRFWPPFFGAGIKVQEYNEELTFLVVQMKMRFWNKNYVGTHFGGSLYTMTDPFYMLMLMQQLGKDYIVWDKSAIIHYKRPAIGTVTARFDVSKDTIESIKKRLEHEKKIEPTFKIQVRDSMGQIVAEIEKTLHIYHKKHKA